MSKENLLVGVLIEESTTYTFAEVCHKYRIPKELLLEMVEQGLFSAQPIEPEHITLDQKALKRMETAFLLNRYFDINIPGVAFAIELF